MDNVIDKTKKLIDSFESSELISKLDYYKRIVIGNKELLDLIKGQIGGLLFDIWDKYSNVSREKLEEKYGKTLTAEDYFVPDYKRKSPLIKCFEEYMNKVLSEWKFSLEDIEEKHFVDKNIVEQSKAFEHLDNLNLNKNNAFLLSKRNHH